MAHPTKKYKYRVANVKINTITPEYIKIMLADLEWEESLTREEKLIIREKTRNLRPPII